MAEIPIEKVKQMRQKGVSDDKIVESLQKEGFKSSQIFDAMSQADLQPASGKNNDDFPDIMGHMEEKSDPPSFDEQEAPSFRPGVSHSGPNNFRKNMTSKARVSESNEELIESIIDEKWTDIKRNIQKVIEWKNSTEKKIDSLEKDINNLDEKFDKLHKAIVSKVGEYDKNILNVGADIKAMEKAFSKILPEFSQSVSELTELVEDLKENKK